MAAAGGHQGMVGSFLERTGTRPDRNHKYGKMPLSPAAEYRGEGVVATPSK